MLFIHIKIFLIETLDAFLKQVYKTQFLGFDFIIVDTVCLLRLTVFENGEVRTKDTS